MIAKIRQSQKLQDQWEKLKQLNISVTLWKLRGLEMEKRLAEKRVSENYMKPESMKEKVCDT